MLYVKRDKPDSTWIISTLLRATRLNYENSKIHKTFRIRHPLKHVTGTKRYTTLSFTKAIQKSYKIKNKQTQGQSSCLQSHTAKTLPSKSSSNNLKLKRNIWIWKKVDLLNHSQAGFMQLCSQCIRMVGRKAPDRVEAFDFLLPVFNTKQKTNCVSKQSGQHTQSR